MSQHNHSRHAAEAADEDYYLEIRILRDPPTPASNFFSALEEQFFAEGEALERELAHCEDFSDLDEHAGSQLEASWTWSAAS